ncbi:hypothetical protein K1719_002339 [Acacia pycnantha]|nr:hypothetical protein K1719_002339 [Acacia pycnantha]
MKLVVRVVEARIPNDYGLSDPYVRVQLGKQKFKTKVLKKCVNAKWDEEFSFRVEDLDEELMVCVMDEDKYFNDDFVGQFKMPISLVFEEESKSLSSWFSLQPKSKKSKPKECGELRLSICLTHKSDKTDALEESNPNSDQFSHSRKCSDALFVESPLMSFSSCSASSSPWRYEEVTSSKDEKPQKTFACRIAQIFNKGTDISSVSIKSNDSEQAESIKAGIDDIKIEDQFSENETFEEVVKKMQALDNGTEIPSNLPGGVLIDQLYIIAPEDLNTLLFSPDSNFPKSLADFQGTTELQIGPWKFENEGTESSLKRSLTYVKAATKLVKAIKAYEKQTYVKADGKNFAVFANVSTPDVMYGNTFKAELLYVITPGPELPSEEHCSRLLISWRLNFVQSTMMKGMIENGARQGMKDSFNQYASLLCETVKPVDSKDLGSSKEQILASLQAEKQSDRELAVQYFANFTVLTTVIIDSIGEFVASAILVVQGQKLLGFISHFMRARRQNGGDHGIKAQGDGWLLTVALIEGSNIASVNSSGISDPYVVFSCNGKTRTSSAKFRNSNPIWNEVFEFDAMDDPPSVLNVEVFDFDGPFDENASLGQAKINFLKTNISDLADIRVPLEGKFALASQSKLELRIFLDNTRGSSVIKQYISKMEKEVGKKINLRSPQTNSAFQKLFGLPHEEFLINDFTCYLKRKMPMQGRIFLSARIFGFHANIFGRKTTFFLLWDDIDDIQVIRSTFASMGSPIIAITLQPGRGMDTKHCAKSQDEEGRLKFHFQSFVSFNVAYRTIMAVWKTRSCCPEQKDQMVEDDSDENGSFVDLDDVSMSEVHCSTLPTPTSFFMELFNGGDLDRRFMEKSGCINYSFTPWVSENNDVYERALYYKYDKSNARFKGEVTSTQQRTSLPDGKGWILEEVMNLHGVPLSEYFNLHLRYQVEDLPAKKSCKVHVYYGIEWLKSSKHHKKISKNILRGLQERLKLTFGVIEKEFSST